MSNNFWMGNTELIIIYESGTHKVNEVEGCGDHMHSKTVFTGNFEECLEYCKKQESDYRESIIG